MAVVQLEAVKRAYLMGDQHVAALDGVTFEVKEGELVAIVGSSGSGKSTLLNILGCLDRPTGGTYRLSGHDVKALSDDERSALRNRQIGFVFQSFHLLPRATAIDNVALPLVYRGMKPRERRALAREVLERVELGHRLDHRPYQLSGGQRQRVAIARALVGKPSLLLCDEPTGNLDSATGEEILGLFLRLHAEGTTVLLVTHEPSIAARCPRVIRISDGRIVSDGSPG